MKSLSRAQVLGTLLTLVVVGAIVGGLVLIGPPSEERVLRLDQRRVDDLAATSRAVDLYWSRHARLPASLAELGQEPGSHVALSDPDTGEAYEYQPVEGVNYEVCARFDRETPADGRSSGDVWSHGAGRQCFRREARPIR